MTSFQDGSEVTDVNGEEVTDVKEEGEDPLAITLESEQEVSFVSVRQIALVRLINRVSSLTGCIVVNLL
jgi:hypothetical protein